MPHFPLPALYRCRVELGILRSCMALELKELASPLSNTFTSTGTEEERTRDGCTHIQDNNISMEMAGTPCPRG